VQKTYIIHLSPVAWSRPGVNFKNGAIYDSQKHLKSVLRENLKRQHVNSEGEALPLFKGPVRIRGEFVFTYPESWSKSKREANMYHQVKPDSDNLEKLLFDCLSGILIVDDAVISHNEFKKIYGDTPRTVFTVEEIE